MAESLRLTKVISPSNMPKSNLEETLAANLREAGITGWVREYKFHPSRRWRFDFAWPERKLAIEVEGGIWISGRHNRGVGMSGDCEKHNTATSLGWDVYRFTPRDIKTNMAMVWIEKALGGDK